VHETGPLGDLAHGDVAREGLQLDAAQRPHAEPVPDQQRQDLAAMSGRAGRWPKAHPDVGESQKRREPPQADRAQHRMVRPGHRGEPDIGAPFGLGRRALLHPRAHQVRADRHERVVGRQQVTFGVIPQFVERLSVAGHGGPQIDVGSLEDGHDAILPNPVDQRMPESSESVRAM
jgi:hypothetical protein